MLGPDAQGKVLWTVSPCNEEPETFANSLFPPSSILQYELDPAQGETRQRPLFVHSNLLKHISGVRRGETFTHVVSLPLETYT
jgi:hypothetical protein